MSEPFLAEIRIFSFNFPPKGWALCNGGVVPIEQNTALFALIGTKYGGNGTSNFGLPDMLGRAPMHWGAGHGLGERGGSETVTLIESELPSHLHAVLGDDDDAQFKSAAGMFVGAGNTMYLDAQTPTPNTALAPGTLVPAGEDQPHNNMQPYLTLYFCIALKGFFPSRLDRKKPLNIV